MARRTLAAWIAVAVALAVPVALAAGSPLLAWRQPVYIAAGLAGVTGLCLMVLQPLLAGGFLPGPGPGPARRLHRAVGGMLFACVALHVAGLWLTSPPDTIDALLFRAPTAFSVFGVIAMWALLAAVALAAMRRRMPPAVWRRGHRALAAILVGASVLHVLPITGTMESLSKIALCLVLPLLTAAALLRRRAWIPRPAPASRR